MNFRNPFLLLMLLVTISCKEPQAQYPINKSKKNNASSSITRNKTIYSNEMGFIINRVQSDSTLRFIPSEKGFWYAFISRLSNDNKEVKPGDLIHFKMKIESINQQLIYDWDVAGVIPYRVNKEDILPILREGIQLMSLGDKAVFYSPSHLGFGYLGDGNKIGVNQPLRISVEVLKTLND
ncbi:MAG: hypothetical protein OXE77_05740 [Flavobacteriaceae bacterium]|nr:hypothetical protein [Flavobacteriaceae bacterium]MCY4300099.1 hypothetical protein [Flavobacteriaceae bacterium]